MNLGEDFTSISKMESYLYEWYFHPYVTSVSGPGWALNIAYNAVE